MNLDCTINCPEANEDSTFRVQIEGGDSTITPLYRWSALNGRIIRGQGTSVLTARFDDPCRPMTITVEINGLPPECTYRESCTTRTHCCWGAARKFDEFGNICCGDEKARLDNFAINLLKDPGAQGYIIIYEGRRYASCYNPRPRIPRRGEAAARAARMKPYLVDGRGMDANRLILIDGGYREEWMAELWIVPKGANPPKPRPTLEAKDIRFRKGKIPKDAYDCME